MNQLVCHSVPLRTMFGDSISECKKLSPCRIHWQLAEVYEEGVMNEGNVRKWCRLFNGARSDVHNEGQS